MGWFKENVEERIAKLEAEVSLLRRQQSEPQPPSEGEYIGKIVRLDVPRRVPVGYRFTFVVNVPGQTDYARVNLLTDTMGVADAIWAAREFYVGKHVRLKARHRYVGRPDDPRIVTGWSIINWEGSDDERC